jgi:UDP-glucose 4-epimerase
MSVLVIGGTGFIGSRAVKFLLEQGEQIVVMDLFPNLTRVEEIKDELTIVQGSITSIETIIETIKKHQVSKIINTAYHLESESEQYPHEAIKVNLLGTNNVFEAARIMGIKRVIWASSLAVYGDKKSANGIPQNEDAPCLPLTVYGAGKQFSEFMIHSYNNKYGMDIVGLRPSPVYGTGRSTGTTAWLSDFVDMPVRGEVARIPPSPEQTLGWCYVDDAAAAFVAVCQHEGKCPSEIYNIGAFGATVEEMMGIVSREVPGTRVEYGDRYIYYLDVADNSRIKRDIGFELKFDLEKGVKEHISCALSRFGERDI